MAKITFQRILGLIVGGGALLQVACGGGGGSSSLSSGGTGGTLNVHVNGGTPLWAAYQDGNGTWTPLSLSSGSGSVTVRDGAGRYGLAMGYLDLSGNRILRLWQATVAERPGIAVTLPVARITLSVPVTGLGAGEDASVSFGTSQSRVDSTTLPQVTCRPGTSDLVLSVLDAATRDTLRTSIQRGLTFTTSTTLPTQNLSGGTPTGSIGLNVSGITAGGYVDLYGGWVTKAGVYAPMGSAQPAGSTGFVRVAPTSLFQAGDTNFVEGWEYLASGYHYYGAYLSSGVSAAFTLPPPMTGGVAVTGGLVDATWSAVSGARDYLGYLDQPGSGLYIRASVSPGWAGGGTTLTYHAPDLSGIAGGGWAFVSGQQVDWEIDAVGSNTWYTSAGTFPAVQSGDWEWGTGVYNSLVPGVADGPLLPRRDLPRAAHRARVLAARRD